MRPLNLQHATRVRFVPFRKNVSIDREMVFECNAAAW
jgi:hypothetical protein